MNYRASITRDALLTSESESACGILKKNEVVIIAGFLVFEFCIIWLGAFSVASQMERALFLHREGEGHH